MSGAYGLRLLEKRDEDFEVRSGHGRILVS